VSSSIPFNKPFLTGKELHYIAQAITTSQVAADGPFTQRCSRLLEERFKLLKVLMTPSCTAALEMAALLCGLEAEDEVILPSFTFSSTANAFMRLGARPVFVDIRSDTLNLDERLLEGAITPRTKAIFPVHYAGVSCNMTELMRLAAAHELLVVEDAAQGVNAFYDGHALGGIGHLGTYSFHDTKNVIAGEGGALCINTPELIERAEVIRDKGTNRKQFISGAVDKYTWVDIGSSYVPSEICCAFLYAQLEMLDAITARRQTLYERYMEHLQPLQERGWLRLPHIPTDCTSNYHLFHILLPDGVTRDALMTYLKYRGINAVFHYVPLHTAPMGKSLGYREGDLPLTESLSERLLRLPLYYELTEEHQLNVVRCISEFCERGWRR
jgi:dTDP-4-amino-4,6-dideoxygalactose transaminase